MFPSWQWSLFSAGPYFFLNGNRITAYFAAIENFTNFKQNRQIIGNIDIAWLKIDEVFHERDLGCKEAKRSLLILCDWFLSHNVDFV